jgi:hypothetical protein
VWVPGAARRTAAKMLSEGSYTPCQLYSAITASATPNMVSNFPSNTHHMDCEGSAAKFNPTIVIDRAENLE